GKPGARASASARFHAQFVLTEKMPKRRRKRGRPRTGHDPMVGVRLPVATIKKLGKMAEALGCDRSTAIRWLLDEACSRGRAAILLRSARRQSEKSRRRLADEIADATIAGFRAKIVAKHAAAHAGPPADKVKAEINALRVLQAAAARLSALGD